MPKYRTFNVTSTELGQGQSLVRSRRTGAKQILTTKQLQLLFSCRTFKELSEHARNYCRQSRRREMEALSQTSTLRGTVAHWALRLLDTADVGLPAGDRQVRSIEEELRKLVEAGFLVSESDLRTTLVDLSQDRKTESSVAQISCIGIPTNDRPELLERAISSHATNIKRHTREVEFVVMDDTDENGNRERNREVLAELQRDYGLPIHYADRERRALYADTLAEKTGVDTSIVRFALLGDKQYLTYGAPRNALLLDTGGSMTMQIDDDSVCDVVLPNTQKQGLEFSDRAHDRGLWFPSDSSEVGQSVNHSKGDILGFHETLLGKSLGTCIRTVASEPNLLSVESLSPDFFERIKDGSVRVLATIGGLYGDSGATSYAPRLLLQGAPFDRLTQSKEYYRRSLKQRDVIRVPPRFILSGGNVCPPMHLGLDNRTLLPPFLPILKGEEHIFGYLMSQCLDTGKGYLPYGVYHDPPGNRESLQLNTRPRTNHVLRVLMRSFEDTTFGEKGPERIVEMGRALRDVSRRSLESFIEYTHNQYVSEVGHRIARMKNTLSNSPSRPAYWREDALQYITSLKNLLTEKGLAGPMDLNGTYREKMSQLQRTVLKFGSLMINWPDLVAASQQMKENGYRLTQPIGE